MSQLKIKNGNNWESIPAGGIGVPSGGTTGQYLKKSSSADYATEWENFPTILTQTTAQLTTIVSFSSISANRLTRVGNIVVLEFRGTAASAAGGTWKRILALPDGWEAKYSGSFFAVYNNNPTVSFVYGNTGETKNKSINIAANYPASADISIFSVYTALE